MNRAEKRRNKKLAAKAAKVSKPVEATAPMALEQQQTLTIQQALDLGLQHQKAGDLPKAESICKQILQAEPNQPVALHLLGVISHQSGNSDVAVDLITKANSFQYDYAEAFGNLGQIMKNLGEPIPARLGFLISYFKTLGGFNSSQEKLVNVTGEPIPLLTSGFLHWFETINWSHLSFLELGSGNSTLYFSRHFKFVSSFESNQNWYQKLGPMLPKNVNYKYANPILLALKNENLKNHDVILIDAGENRAKIARVISETDFTGLIFFDNAEWYRHGVSILTKAGYTEIPFFGIKPVTNYVSCTSILVKPDSIAKWFTSDWLRQPALSTTLMYNSWDDENEDEGK